MPKGYVIFTEQVHDAEAMGSYSQGAIPSLLEAGGRIAVADTDASVLEGEGHGSQTVVLEFDTVEAARGWYESEGYQALIPQRQAAADSNVVLLTGFEMP